MANHAVVGDRTLNLSVEKSSPPKSTWFWPKFCFELRRWK